MPKSLFYAKREDDREISRLLESPVDNGLIQAIYTRRPDAYDSYMKEYGESTIYEVRFSAQKGESISFDTEHIATEFSLF